MPAIRGNGLNNLIDGSSVSPNRHTAEVNEQNNFTTTENPAYALWRRQDQLLLNWLLSTILENIITTVTHCITSQELWFMIERFYALQSITKSIALKMQLYSARKDTQNITEYCTKVRDLANELQMAGKPVSEEDLCSYVLTGLGQPFKSVVVNLTSRLHELTSLFFSRVFGTCSSESDSLESSSTGSILPA